MAIQPPLRRVEEQIPLTLERLNAACRWGCWIEHFDGYRVRLSSGQCESSAEPVAHFEGVSFLECPFEFSHATFRLASDSEREALSKRVHLESEDVVVSIETETMASPGKQTFYIAAEYVALLPAIDAESLPNQFLQNSLHAINALEMAHCFIKSQESNELTLWGDHPEGAALPAARFTGVTFIELPTEMFSPKFRTATQQERRETAARIELDEYTSLIAIDACPPPGLRQRTYFIAADHVQALWPKARPSDATESQK